LLFEDEALSISFIQSDAGGKARLELISMFQPEMGTTTGAPLPDRIEQARTEALRLMIIPSLRIMLKAANVVADDLNLNADGKIEVRYENIEKSPWYTLYLQVETILASVVNALYLVVRDAQILKLSTEMQYKYSSQPNFVFF
jgi:hypothetical protein